MSQQMEFTLKVKGRMYRAGENVEMVGGEMLLSMYEDRDGATFLAASAVPEDTLVGLVVLPAMVAFNVVGTPVSLETLVETQGTCYDDDDGDSNDDDDDGDSNDDEDSKFDEDSNDSNDDEDEVCSWCGGIRYSCECEDECGDCSNIKAECACQENVVQVETPDVRETKIETMCSVCNNAMSQCLCT